MLFGRFFFEYRSIFKVFFSDYGMKKAVSKNRASRFIRLVPQRKSLHSSLIGKKGVLFLGIFLILFFSGILVSGLDISQENNEQVNSCSDLDSYSLLEASVYSSPSTVTTFPSKSIALTTDVCLSKESVFLFTLGIRNNKERNIIKGILF